MIKPPGMKSLLGKWYISVLKNNFIHVVICTISKEILLIPISISDPISCWLEHLIQISITNGHSSKWANL